MGCATSNEIEGTRLIPQNKHSFNSVMRRISPYDMGTHHFKINSQNLRKQ